MLFRAGNCEVTMILFLPYRSSSNCIRVNLISLVIGLIPKGDYNFTNLISVLPIRKK